MALITCRDVSFAYEGITVVTGLNFTVESGDYVCVVGENGSGKSTLLKGLLRLKSPQSGSIVTGDGLKPHEIGFLPQQMEGQKDFPASVYEVVLSGRLNTRSLKPFYSKTDKMVLEENLKKLNISDLKNKCFRELSGGQQRRVLLCRALCATKKLLLLDEPAAGLDPVAAHEMYQLIEDLNGKMGLTVVMVSHDLTCASRYASHILHIKRENVFFGTTAEYREKDMGFSGGREDG